jgi:hypothetical protein
MFPEGIRVEGGVVHSVLRGAAYASSDIHVWKGGGEWLYLCCGGGLFLQSCEVTAAFCGVSVIAAAVEAGCGF